MNAFDMLKNTVAIAAVGAVSVGALAIGTLVTRHPETARRAVRTLMHGAQRVGLALAQSREDMGDLWAEVRDELRDDLDFEQLRNVSRYWTAEATGDAAESSETKPRKPAKSTAKAAKSGAKPRATSKRSSTAKAARTTRATTANGEDRRRQSRSRPH